jgi:hypothetical protein
VRVPVSLTQYPLTEHDTEREARISAGVAFLTCQYILAHHHCRETWPKQTLCSLALPCNACVLTRGLLARGREHSFQFVTGFVYGATAVRFDQ